MLDSNPIQVLLLDIEGTTTPISFVYDVLFPYIREHLHAYLHAHFADPACHEICAAIAAEEGQPPTLEGVIQAVTEQMDADKKSTSLKALQGRMWRSGYESGNLKGALFDDVLEVINEARAHDVRVCIYSSGSVAAQKLLFGYSTEGDVTPKLSGYFDTTTGPKKVAASYSAIAEALGVDPPGVLFCTDNVAEARAARDAGVRCAVLDRPGNPDQGEHDFDVWQTLRPALNLL